MKRKGIKIDLGTPEPERTLPMDDDKWQEFFDLIGDITNDEGSWQGKCKRVCDKATQFGEETALEEFLGWFGGDLPTTEHARSEGR